jgi:mannonate dehydratase
MGKIRELFKMYEGVDDEVLFGNLVYFLEAIMPVCDKYDIKMAIHPDDPAWPVFGLSRIITSKSKIQRLLKAVDNDHNGITLCTGSLGSNRDNDLVDIIHSVGKRIHFAHIRNIRFTGEGTFEEAAHLSEDGSLDMFAIMKALHDTGFDGPIRPDHGRMVWGEKAMPGYGLYDRAMGACYLNGLWEAIEKESK